MFPGVLLCIMVFIYMCPYLKEESKVKKLQSIWIQPSFFSVSFFPFTDFFTAVTELLYMCKCATFCGHKTFSLFGELLYSEAEHFSYFYIVDREATICMWNGEVLVNHEVNGEVNAAAEKEAVVYCGGKLWRSYLMQSESTATTFCVALQYAGDLSRGYPASRPK